MDGFGRAIQTITGNGSTTVSTVDVQYAPCGCSPLGKLSRQSAPYAPGGSDAWTTYNYDASGRTLTVVLPDTSFTTYYYEGNWVGVTDPASNTKSFDMDAFGNLLAVAETDPSLGLVWTYYTYDVLNHLTNVSMPRGGNTQTRTFNYTTSNVVGAFLLSATNPENGTVTYTYNSNNMLASKTDAKGNQLTYQYDSYNRLTSVTWANAPSGAQVLRSYMYDNNTLDSSFSGSYTQGRLVAVQNAQFTPGNGSLVNWVQLVEMYGYTQPGSVSGKRLQANEHIPYPVGYGQTLTRNLDAAYTYDTEGKMTSAGYPTTWTYTGGGVAQSTPGPTYSYSFDSMSRLAGMTDQNSNTDVSGVTYNAANQLTGITYFGSPETRSYNSLGQMTQLYVNSGLYYNYNYPSGTNNGKISSTYEALSGETISYTYDSLNRMATAAGSGWAETYGYDGFGNLATKTPTLGTPPSLSQVANQTNNQIVGYSYDANGNQLGAPGFYGSPTYDVENRMIAAPGVQYAYDSHNKRVWAATVDSSNNLTGQTVNFYGVNGQKIGSYSLAVNYGAGQLLEFSDPPANLAVYFGGKRVATTDQYGTTTSYWQDRLGSNRNSGSRYYPWGEDRSTPSNDQVRFATYTRDSATLLDYADQRYYGNAQGRFMTPDPATGNAQGTDPGTWNRYAYAGGDPVNKSDPSGLGVTCFVFNGQYICVDDVSGTVIDVPDQTQLPGLDPWWDGLLQAGEAAAQKLANKQTYFPPLTGSNLTDYNNALDYARNQVASVPGCDQALNSVTNGAIPSLSGLLNSSLLNTNVYDGSNSGYPTTTPNGALETVAQYFQQNGSKTGAITFIVSGGNVSFLGPAFFNPGEAGVQAAYIIARAFMVLHEAVHLVAGLTDQYAGWGSSKALTKLLVDDCFPILGKTGMLGGLYQ